VWPDHPLGRPIIGYPEVIQRLTREELLQYLAQHYVPGRMIFAGARNVEHDAFVAEVQRQWGDHCGRGVERVLCKPETHLDTELVPRKTEQAHFCMGIDGVDETHPDRWTARVLNLILGGGMSSRLFQEVREKRGLCYSIGSELATYREGGLLVIYADTSPAQMEEVRDLCLQEMRTMARNGVTAEELARAKNQVRAGLLLSLDDIGSRMNRLAHSLLFHGRVIPPSELRGYVEAVTLEDCRRVAASLFGEERVAFTAIGPFKKKRR
jgi:predicted Zn-dependent peptidase